MNCPAPTKPKDCGGSLALLRKAKPQDVDGRAEVEHLQLRPFAHHGTAPVRADDQAGAHFQLALRRLRLHAGDTLTFPQQDL